MSNLAPQPIYRKDYKPSNYLIHTTDLSFDLRDDETLVSSKIHFYKNPKYQAGDNSLFLDGIDLELISLVIDGERVDYELSDKGMQLRHLKDEFVLEIVNRIHPELNTSLNGLYQSSGNFCTQCEAHGFRQITYYLDRPDVLSVFTTHITADKRKYPVLLSNGNLLTASSGQATWHDPTSKPCYLFALVAGDFAVLEDNYTTLSGREVALKIYVEAHNISKTQFAMDSLKRSFAWDESRFNLEYDLDIYMIVAVDDFNMGAMENKGLNIFNSTYVLAEPKTATDKDFINVEAVIGHEYFHNWTGNRVTCKDWFQLSLKEGLTVFRDQEFTSDLHSRSIKRIEDVNALRTFQFAEDAGPMQHPVRPESYIEMNNFYTLTIYEKGAEVIRMIHSFLGETGFQKGMKLYFERHDGDAVTIDDFVSSMSDANEFDFSQFMTWYSQPGTPTVSIKTNYDEISQRFHVEVEQNKGHDYFLPLNYALLDDQGHALKEGMLTIKQHKESFVFEQIKSKPTPSWLRGFCAPIHLLTDLTFEQKIFLVGHDSDAYVVWDSAQQIWLSLILTPNKAHEQLFFNALEKLIQTTPDKSLVSEVLTLPSERFLHQQVAMIDVFDINQKREQMAHKVLRRFEALLLETYNSLNNNQAYQLTSSAVGGRSLKNTCLYYLSKDKDSGLALTQFEQANCMTDQIAAFNALITNNSAHKDQAIASFYQTFKQDVQVMDKFFAAQSSSITSDIGCIKSLMQHELFSFNTPNRLRSVVGGFTQNYINFHHQAGYEFFTDIILKLNQSNPQIGARLVSVYNHWKRFTPELKQLQKQQLERIMQSDDLSNDIFEIVQAALK
ncbi:aminopeptidase N [Candidatus Thioglobus autotrophicus]|uniref:Aminopeptidase N n=1 Tax=Candidatus Thioglobus autotrophicus TaxID=1705394 RepID=A0A0M4NW33_9GAMM|nr:aminopeptidase N [Candidatus Thioglobus autotrophicus]ALE51877.1 aminopeptidase N [Candidatus Thioglobus autotrophicus]